jgi:hypothetical protein
MKNLPDGSHAGRRFAPTALMFGNLITGCSVLAPAGMLIELSSDLGVTVTTAGLLITFGRGSVMHWLAANGVADQLGRAPHLADDGAGGARFHQRGLGAGA